MNGPRHDDDPQTCLLDCLAAGDLDGAARHDLFAWLDREPSRWRRCALALLEARELEQALGDWTAEVPKRASARSPGTLKSVLPPPPARRVWGERFALAASVLIAFGLGIALRGVWIAPGQAVVQAPRVSDDVRPPFDSRPADRTPAASTGLADSQPNDRADATLVAEGRLSHEAAEPIPAYVRSQLERRGYRVDSRHGVVRVSLPDGRGVMLPNNQLQFSYLGKRSY